MRNGNVMIIIIALDSRGLRFGQVSSYSYGMEASLHFFIRLLDDICSLLVYCVALTFQK